jgi:curved DNA-binding protein CbpA
MDKNSCLSILGLGETASQEDIKKAYKKLALKYHPDKQDPAASVDEKQIAETKFKEVAEAYDLLMNPDKLHKVNEGSGFGHGFGHGFVDPNELFNQIFRDMNMHSFNGGQPGQQIHINLGDLGINLGPGINLGLGFNPGIMRSTSVCFINGQRVENITEVINGVTHQRTFVTRNIPNPLFQ